MNVLAPIGLILIAFGLAILGTSLMTSFLMWDWQWFWETNVGWRVLLVSILTGWGGSR